MEDNKTDTAKQDKPDYCTINDVVAFVVHQTVGKKGISAIVEGRNGVIYREIQGLPERKIMDKAYEKKKCSYRLNDKGKDKYRPEYLIEVSFRTMQECCLYNLSPLERDIEAHHAEKKHGKGYNAQPAALEEDDGYDLACQRKVFSDINNRKSGHTDC